MTVDLFIPDRISNVDAILFDLDGTLIDSLDLHIEAFQWILDKLGRSIHRNQLEPLMGRTPQDIIQEFFGDLSTEELLKAATQKEQKLSEIIRTVYVYPGIKEFLEELQVYKVRRIVISSTHSKLVKILLDKADLLPLIDDIVSGDEVSKGKPDPEPFNHGLEKSGMEPSRVVAIGDSVHDFLSASRANLRFIGVLTGKTNVNSFLEIGCSFMIQGVTDIKIEHK